jgi:hypothetical protein
MLSLTANYQAQYFKHSAPTAFAGLRQITQHRLTLGGMESVGGNFQQHFRHDALPLPFATHEAPRLTRITAS